MEMEEKYFIEINIENRSFYRIYQYINSSGIRYRIVRVEIDDDEIKEYNVRIDLSELELIMEIKPILENSFCFAKMKRILEMINEETKKYFPCVKSLRLMKTTEKSREYVDRF
ncbi:MAG: hypothetical protein DRI61_11520 [Chloroflexi bacterium]|nr:MAG: hypothetical protein DRI61_11520 [Chloroflexota bacterium]